MEYILENVVSDSLYSFQERTRSQAFSWDLSRAEQIKEQLYSSKLPRKNVELFSAWKQYVRSLMHLRFWEILKHFQNGKITLETL